MRSRIEPRPTRRARRASPISLPPPRLAHLAALASPRSCRRVAFVSPRRLVSRRVATLMGPRSHAHSAAHVSPRSWRRARLATLDLPHRRLWWGHGGWVDDRIIVGGGLISWEVGVVWGREAAAEGGGYGSKWMSARAHGGCTASRALLPRKLLRLHFKRRQRRKEIVAAQSAAVAMAPGSAPSAESATPPSNSPSVWLSMNMCSSSACSLRSRSAAAATGAAATGAAAASSCSRFGCDPILSASGPALAQLLRPQQLRRVPPSIQARGAGSNQPDAFLAFTPVKVRGAN